MRGLMLMLLPIVLLAQRPPASPGAAFERELKKNRFGTWLVLEDEASAWGTAMRAALDEEPMVLLNLPLKVVAGGMKPQALAPLLRERFGWAKGAHWALVDARGAVRMEGSSAPTVATLARAAEQGGMGSRIQELEAFLRQHPDRTDARFAVVRESLQVATRRTRKALPPEASPQEATPPKEPIPLRLLGPELDLKIWAGTAQHLDLLLREAGSLPGMMDYLLGIGLRRSLMERSPLMIALLTKHRAAIEEALQRNPDDDGTWLLWVHASRKCGGWPLRPLLATLEPLPGTPPGFWPPEAVLKFYLEDAKAMGDWVAIRSSLEPRWAAVRDSILDGDVEYGNTSQFWDALFQPLLEAFLVQGDVGAADQLLSEASSVAPWPGLPAKAKELATRLNRPDLAARWGALGAAGK